MEQRLSLVTLGVSDLPRAVAFYEGVLGWRTAASPPGVVFFDLNGMIFALWPHSDLAKDMKADPAARGAYPGYSLAHNVGSVAEVDWIFANVKKHGATIDKPPVHTDWGGYAGYFSDPDGHRWEIAWNPHWTILADGRISLTQK
jgi:catechol 2,3-dioxygenase-like lactoylglutathione lyase family enzyme